MSTVILTFHERAELIADLPLATWRKKPLPKPDYRDPKVRFARHNFSEEKLRMLGHYMKQPCDLEPMPTSEELDDSPRGLFYFGIYVTDNEVRDFAEKYHGRELNCPDVTHFDMLFMMTALSQYMEGDYAVRFEEGIVTQKLKDAIPEIEEDIGEEASLIVILSTNDHYVGYHPSNREVKDLTTMLKREPCWWPAAAD